MKPLPRGRGLAAFFLLADAIFMRAVRMSPKALKSLRSAKKASHARCGEDRPGLKERRRRQVGKELGALDSLLDAVLGFLPISYHLIAARTATSVFVWEVAVSPTDLLGQPRAEFLRRFDFPGAGAATFTFGFVPGTETLVGSTSEADIGIFWDARSGKEMRRIRDAQVYHYSHGGDKVVGFAPTDSVLALWDLRAPERRHWNQSTSGIEFAALSPTADRFAAVVRHFSELAGEEYCSVGSWNTTSGEAISVRSVPPIANLQTTLLSAEYDGEYLMLCRGSQTPALCFNLKGGVGGCGNIGDPWGPGCDDAKASGGSFLSGGLILQTYSTHARIWQIEGDDVSLVHETNWPLTHGMSLGHFSSDGRKALVVWRLLQSFRAYIWSFAEGVDPIAIPDPMHEAPIFSETSDAVFSIVDDRQQVAIWDLKGEQRLLLQAPDLFDVRGVAAGDCCRW